MNRIVLLGAALAACTSVRMVQRDGCWLKETSSMGSTHEELGFCQRPTAEPAQDRLAQLEQESMAQADYRWQNRAISAWTHNQPIPAQESDAETTKICMQQATTAMGMQAENDALKSRLAELGQDRDSLRAVADQDRQFMQQSSDKMVTALGEAAKKPAPNATATATSTGTAQTKSDTSAAQQPPAATVVAMPAAAPAPVRVHATAPACTPAIKKVSADKVQCEKVAAETPHN
jgi:hypothetical protein